MATATGTYLGDLRVELRHEQSGATIVTDAPVDNHGKGEAFSPTDMVGAALGACAMTIIGIYAQAHDVDVRGMKMEVTKTMSADPRRIGKLDVTFIMPPRAYSDKEKISIERAARTCPVHLSLHPDTEQVFTFVWQE
ncbi:OsmC family protein [uncultured Desulfovibrio sp.]|uniref:OsmC family protein n=1 Tax=uncultured Desulfovibrio sp. TaxID=167968 RepID=UPI0032096A8D